MESQLLCQDSLKTYGTFAKTAYYSAWIQNDKNNPMFLFRTVAKLTKSQSSVEP